MNSIKITGTDKQKTFAVICDAKQGKEIVAMPIENGYSYNFESDAYTNQGEENNYIKIISFDPYIDSDTVSLLTNLYLTRKEELDEKYRKHDTTVCELA